MSRLGGCVTVGRRDSDWPAFVFVTAAGGSGWVPSRYLSADAGRAVVETHYNTTELATRSGEILEVVSARTSWVALVSLDQWARGLGSEPHRRGDHSFREPLKRSFGPLRRPDTRNLIELELLSASLRRKRVADDAHDRKAWPRG